MMKKLFHKCVAVYLRDEGITAVEYAILGGLIAGGLAIGGALFVDQLEAALQGLLPGAAAPPV